MYLAKIKDSFMFGGEEGKSHWRIIGKDKEGKIYAIETTHLYNRRQKVKSGLLIARKFSCFKTPSGIYRKRIYKNYYGKKFTYRNISQHAIDKKRNIRIYTIKKQNKKIRSMKFS